MGKKKPPSAKPAANAGERPEKAGLEYAPHVIGKRMYRVSERYVADHVAPLIASHRADAAKLDLALRGIALSPEHAGARQPGLVLRRRGRVDYAALHDLVRDPRRFATTAPEDDDDVAVERATKREWVREQLQLLEERQLLVRQDRGDGPWDVVMLRDLGDGEPFDDPGAVGHRRSYVTVLGPVVADQRFRTWGSREVVGYLCAMVADRYARNQHERDTGEALDVGSATWYRQAKWFNNENGYRHEGHVALPFSTTTIERGLKAMRELGYIFGERKKKAPDGKRFEHPRMIYTNEFHLVGAGAEIIDLTARIQSA
jgi:hypothetical protein